MTTITYNSNNNERNPIKDPILECIILSIYYITRPFENHLEDEEFEVFESYVTLMAEEKPNWYLIKDLDYDFHQEEIDALEYNQFHCDIDQIDKVEPFMSQDIKKSIFEKLSTILENHAAFTKIIITPPKNNAQTKAMFWYNVFIIYFLLTYDYKIDCDENLSCDGIPPGHPSHIIKSHVKYYDCKVILDEEITDISFYYTDGQIKGIFDWLESEVRYCNFILTDFDHMNSWPYWNTRKYELLVILQRDYWNYDEY